MIKNFCLRKNFLSIIFIINLVFSTVVHGQSGSIAIQSRVDRNKIRIGDLIKYTIIVQHDKNVEIQMPALGANLGSFEIRDYVDLQPVKQEGKIIHQREFTISTFETGDFEIPPVEVRYRTVGDTTWKAISTEKLKITVESMKPSEEGDIRDIKSPLEIPRDWWRLIRWILAGVLVVAIGVVAYVIVKRHRQGKSIIPRKEKPKRPPHEIALEALKELEREKLIEKGEVKLFYIKISEIIRSYFEERFFIPALEMTTGQLIEAMKEAEIENEVIKPTEEFLNLCDLAKFAKYVPSNEENQFALETAHKIVEMTKIVIEPEQEAEATTETVQAAAEEEAVISAEEQAAQLDDGEEN